MSRTDEIAARVEAVDQEWVNDLHTQWVGHDCWRCTADDRAWLLGKVVRLRAALDWALSWCPDDEDFQMRGDPELEKRRTADALLEGSSS